MLSRNFSISFTSIKGYAWDGEKRDYLSIPDNQKITIFENNGQMLFSTNPHKRYKAVHITTMDNNCSIRLRNKAHIDIDKIDYGCSITLEDNSQAEIIEMQGINWPGYKSSLTLKDDSFARVCYIKGETDNTDNFNENEIRLFDNSRLKIDHKCERATIYLQQNSNLFAENILESCIEQSNSSQSTISNFMGMLELRDKSISSIKTTQRYKDISAIHLYNESKIQIKQHNTCMHQYDDSNSEIDLIEKPASLSLFDNSHAKIKTLRDYDAIIEGKNKADIESERISVGKRVIRFFREHI